jgi:pimeloyl-ACP methyl ester carboxylesterase
MSEMRRKAVDGWRLAVWSIVVALAWTTVDAKETKAPEHLTVTAARHPLALWARTTPKAKGAIVLLHGRTWSALPDFDLQVPGQKRSVMLELVARGYDVYALDARGYGSTPRDATGWLTPDRAAKDVAAVLRFVADRERGKHITLLGWSYGSMVAQLTTQREPTLVHDLILFGYPRDPAVRVPALPAPAAPPKEANTRENAASDFISPKVTPQSLIDAYVVAALEADPVRVDWKDLDQWNELDATKIAVPTLLMHGERDPLAKIDAQARQFTTLGTPDKRWVVLAGGDHAALVEDTLPAFVDAVVTFIERPRLAH